MKRFLTLVVFGALPTFALSLVNAPQAFADVKAVVVIECDPHDGMVSTQTPQVGPLCQGDRSWETNALTSWCFWTEPTSK